MSGCQASPPRNRIIHACVSAPQGLCAGPAYAATSLCQHREPSPVLFVIASHIKPWRVADPKTERTNPSNGLCLNALHDKAFDRGLITVLPDYTIRVSSKLCGGDEGTLWLRQCDKHIISLPHHFFPDSQFLEYHNDMVFIP